MSNEKNWNVKKILSRPNIKKITCWNWRRLSMKNKTIQLSSLMSKIYNSYLGVNLWINDENSSVYQRFYYYKSLHFLFHYLNCISHPLHNLRIFFFSILFCVNFDFRNLEYSSYSSDLWIKLNCFANSDLSYIFCPLFYLEDIPWKSMLDRLL